MTKKELKDTKKIVLMGLDNSGKSSILLCLKGVKNLSSFTTIKPTRGFEINNFLALDSEFNIWDFGGQEIFREEYFKNFNNYIKGANKLIYVLDIQDRERYDISVEYFAQIIMLLRKFKVKLEFSLFLHKYDPDMDILEKENKDEIIQNLRERIDDLIPPDFPYQVYKTSIYTVFQKMLL